LDLGEVVKDWVEMCEMSEGFVVCLRGRDEERKEKKMRLSCFPSLIYICSAG
jgi:hypothetical protein